MSNLQPVVHAIFEGKTSTWQYVVACPTTKDAMIIDPVLDFGQEKLTITTDFLKPQETFAERYRLTDDEITNAFDYLFSDNEEFPIGALTARVLHLPGHTPDHVGYVVGENVFTGDSICNPDVGTARCEFPGGNGGALWKTTQKLLSLSPYYRLYTSHDYPPSTGGYPSRHAMPFTTVQEQREHNKHVKNGTDETQFLEWRSERDRGLGEPKLLCPALQTNLLGGRLPNNRAHKGILYFLKVHVPDELSLL